jgi:hypothetical protein
VQKPQDGEFAEMSEGDWQLAETFAVENSLRICRKAKLAQRALDG